jgi:hypothetical protein
MDRQRLTRAGGLFLSHFLIIYSPRERLRVLCVCLRENRGASVKESAHLAVRYRIKIAYLFLLLRGASCVCWVFNAEKERMTSADGYIPLLCLCCNVPAA